MRKKSWKASKLSTIFPSPILSKSKSLTFDNFLIFTCYKQLFFVNNSKIAEVLENFKIHEIENGYARVHILESNALYFRAWLTRQIFKTLKSALRNLKKGGLPLFSVREDVI